MEELLLLLPSAVCFQKQDCAHTTHTIAQNTTNVVGEIGVRDVERAVVGDEDKYGDRVRAILKFHKKIAAI